MGCLFWKILSESLQSDSAAGVFILTMSIGAYKDIAVKGFCMCRCHECDGKGRIPCTQCSSRGLIKCKKCDGSGALVKGKLLTVTWLETLLTFLSEMRILVASYF
jgi:hypothetical protein